MRGRIRYVSPELPKIPKRRALLLQSPFKQPVLSFSASVMVCPGQVHIYGADTYALVINFRS